MRLKKLWIFVAVLAVACGSWAVLFRTNLLPKQKAMVSKFVQDVRPARRKGLIRGIVSSEDSFTALIDTQAVREGDTIYGVKVVKIYVDKVEFEKDGRKWTQELNETPGRQWRKSVTVMANKQADDKPIEDVKATTKSQAEDEAQAQAQAEVRAQAEAKAKAQEEAEAKAQEEAEAKAQAEAASKAQEEAKATAKSQAEDEAKVRAEAEAEA